MKQRTMKKVYKAIITLLSTAFLAIAFNACTLTTTPTNLKIENNILSWDGYKGNSYAIMRQVYQNNEIIDETIVRGESTMMGSAMRLNLQTLPFISGEHVYKVRSHGNVWNSETCRFDKPVISDWSDEIRNTFLIDDEW